MKQEKKVKDYFLDDELDIDRIIEEYNDFLQKLIVNMKLYEFTAEDKQEIIANTFYIILNNYNILDVEKYMSSYLAEILQVLVKEKETVNTERAYTAIDEQKIEHTTINDIDLLVEDRIYFEHILEVINISKDIDKDIFLLKYLNGLSYKEIAINLNLDLKEVKKRFLRLNKKIRRELSKGGCK